MYKLKYYCLGVPISGHNYKVYLRYYFKNKTLNIPTKVILTKEQLKMVNENTYGGSVQSELDRLRSQTIQTIETMKKVYNEYPTPEQLKHYINTIQESLPMEMYVQDYLKQANIKESSRIVYGTHLKHWVRYFNLKLKHLPVQQVVNKQTIEMYGIWMRKLDFSDYQIYNLKNTLFRLLNYIADKQHLNKIDPYLSMPKFQEKYTPTDDEFNMLMNLSVEGNLMLVQDQMYVNSFWGLRIEELLRIKKDNITFNDDHIVVRFLEQKKTSYRDLVLVDERATDIIRNYMTTRGDNLWLGTTNSFNRSLKRLAKLAFGEKTIYMYNEETQEEQKYLIHELISSHSIRRYAITRNIDNYGIDLAKTFSGHQSYEIIKKHYSSGRLSRNITLGKLKNK